MQGDDRSFPRLSITTQSSPGSWQRPPEGAQSTHSRSQDSRGSEEDVHGAPSSPFEPIPSAHRTMSVTQSHPKEGEPNVPLTISLDFYCPPQLQQQLHLAAPRPPEGKQAQIHLPFTFRICFDDCPLETLVTPHPSSFQHPNSQMRFQLHSVVPKRPSNLPHVPVSVQLTTDQTVLDTAQVGVFMYWDSDENPSSAPPLQPSEHAAAPLPHSTSSAYPLVSQPTPKEVRDNGESYSRLLGRNLAQTTRQPVSDSQAVVLQYPHPDPNNSLVYPPRDAHRPPSGLDMPQALAPSMFHTIPTHSPAPPSTPSSGPDSSAVQSSPLEERPLSFIQHHSDATVQLPHSAQSPVPARSSRSSLARKPTPLAQRRARRASAAQTQLSTDTSTPDSGMEGEPEASSSTAGPHKPRGLGVRTSTSGMPSTLVRTSQLSSRRTPRDPVRLLIKGDLEIMTLGWSEKDFHSRRRLVQFWCRQDTADVHLAFKAIPPEEYKPTSIVVSCIYKDDVDACFITSVDLIYLLEMIINTPFSIEEKNRIRRNLEGFKPQTVVKSRPGKGIDPFFALIMGFGDPKPRNIEKDLKVFPWKIIPIALEKVIKKYSYAPTTGALLDPIVAKEEVKAEENSSLGEPRLMDPAHSPEVKLEDFTIGPPDGLSEHKPFRLVPSSSSVPSEGRLVGAPTQQSHQSAKAAAMFAARMSIGLHPYHSSLVAGERTADTSRSSLSSQPTTGSKQATYQTGGASESSGPVSLSSGMDDVNEYLRSTAAYMRSAPEPAIRETSSSPDSVIAEVEQVAQEPQSRSSEELSSVPSQYRSSMQSEASRRASTHQIELTQPLQQYDRPSRGYAHPHTQPMYHFEGFEQPSYSPVSQFPSGESQHPPPTQYPGSYLEVSSYYHPGLHGSQDSTTSYGSAAISTAEPAHRHHEQFPYSAHADATSTHAHFQAPQQTPSSQHSYSSRPYEQPHSYYVSSPEAMLPQPPHMISGIYKDPLMHQRLAEPTGDSRSDDRSASYTWGEYPSYGESSTGYRQQQPAQPNNPNSDFYPRNY